MHIDRKKLNFNCLFLVISIIDESNLIYLRNSIENIKYDKTDWTDQSIMIKKLRIRFLKDFNLEFKSDSTETKRRNSVNWRRDGKETKKKIWHHQIINQCNKELHYKI